MNGIAFGLRGRNLLLGFLACLALLSGCATGGPDLPPDGEAATPVPATTSAPESVPSPTPQVVAEVSTSVPTAAPTVADTVTPLPTASRVVVYSPSARLTHNTPAGECKWIVLMQLSGFAPRSRITVDSDYDEVECASGKVVTGAHWTERYGAFTDGEGRLTVDYLHEATGTYRYTFTDKLGNQATLTFTTEPDKTATPRAKATVAVTPTLEPAPEYDPLAVVKSATLNLREGPDQGYPIVGKLARGDRMYPVAQAGNCEWIQVGVLGRDELGWVAGGPEFVSLNVPCDSLMAVDDLWPTPEPAPPTAAIVESARPATGLLSRSGNSGPGILRIKNGTDGDGIVILVTEAGDPVQAAYIRAGESYEMTQIGDGNYRLYFAKGDGWNAEAKQFARNVTRQRFEDTMVFGGEYAGYEVTLYGVAGGNAATQDVPAGQFPSMP